MRAGKRGVLQLLSGQETRRLLLPAGERLDGFCRSAPSHASPSRLAAAGSSFDAAVGRAILLVCHRRLEVRRRDSIEISSSTARALTLTPVYQTYRSIY
jgi:hypothetical protein